MAEKILTQTGAKVQEDLNFNENLFTYFSKESTYDVGNIVRYEDKIYRCHTKTYTPGAWTGSDNWQEVTIDGILSKMYRHRIKVGAAYYEIMCSIATPFNTTSLASWLYTHGYNSRSYKWFMLPAKINDHGEFNLTIRGNEITPIISQRTSYLFSDNGIAMTQHVVDYTITVNFQEGKFSTNAATTATDLQVDSDDVVEL